ncbi:AAA family ATPase [endosymbiont GvMRE of Glomus versiforme]|uniref:AAA family ATPase n=1 Tax=endosymbiont GvMRE of Glomus versiforme TaxID=2039283 RepID=UPI000EC59E48|nr:ATP-binding protein [endosymbiont GvMRE of Glomus versiforme]RHZ36331.1 ATP-dependent zinc metalloprotease FtsH [endosymbiont GvMRE of Glomus versiforme]
MNFQEQINKAKITLFGNIWIVRLIKLLCYVGCGFLAWLIWKSEYIFGKQTPAQVFKTYIRDWNTKNVNDLLYNLLTIGCFLAIIGLYFYLSGKLVEWLTTINIPASQQDKIFQEKVYSVDGKNNYSVKKVDSLEITGFRNSAYVTCQGIISLQNKQSSKQIAFVIHSHRQNLQEYLVGNKFKDHLPSTNIYFREKTFLTWQKILAAVLVVACGGFFLNRYLKGKAFPETAIGDVLSGENDRQRRQAQEEEKAQKEAEERKKYIVNSGDIDTTWNQIGGLKVAKERMKDNVNLIKRKRQNKDFPVEPEHVLLYGPPGTGKTLLAQAAAKDSGAFFAYATGGQFSGKDRREREEKIHMFLNGVVKETKGDPCILLIDEFEKMTDDENSRQKCTEWNTIMDGIDKKKFPGIVIVAATNKAEQIDLALFRSERFGKKLLISFPEKKELKDIITVTLDKFCEDCKNWPVFFGNKSKAAFTKEFTDYIFKEITETKEYEIDPNELAAGTAGYDYDDKTGKRTPKKVFDEDEAPPRPLFVGADIKKIIYKEAPAIATARGEKAITKDDFKKAIRNTFEYNRSQGLQQKEMLKFIQELIRIKGKKGTPSWWDFY